MPENNNTLRANVTVALAPDGLNFVVILPSGRHFRATENELALTLRRALTAQQTIIDKGENPEGILPKSPTRHNLPPTAPNLTIDAILRWHDENHGRKPEPTCPHCFRNAISASADVEI